VTAETKQTLVAGLVVSHGEQLRRFLMARMRSAADVPDIVQEVFLRMLRVPDHETIRSPEAYLFTVAQHVAQQHALRQATAPMPVELSRMISQLQGTVSTDPAMHVAADQCLEVLQSALDQLSPKARAAFMLHQRDGLSLLEVGQRLGVSRAMVKKYLARALLQFRQRLQDAE
jgi:RNA polymerase sigma factor (sigma-70 family)